MNDSIAQVDLRDDAQKAAFNERAKASMREYLRSKSWVEKVRSIERMNIVQRLAREAMRKAQRELETQIPLRK